MPKIIIIIIIINSLFACLFPKAWPLFLQSYLMLLNFSFSRYSLLCMHFFSFLHDVQTISSFWGLEAGGRRSFRSWQYLPVCPRTCATRSAGAATRRPSFQSPSRSCHRAGSGPLWSSLSAVQGTSSQHTVQSPVLLQGVFRCHHYCCYCYPVKATVAAVAAVEDL